MFLKNSVYILRYKRLLFFCFPCDSLLSSVKFHLSLLISSVKLEQRANLQTKFGLMKYTYLSIVLLTNILLFISCKKRETVFTDNDVFRYNESANIQTLDPAFARNMAIIWPCNQIFNGLVQLDDSLQVQPDIAKSWTISTDGLQYEFILRNDVYFHKHSNFGKDSTRLVTAHDFEYSFDRVLSEDLASPGTWVFQNVKDYQEIGRAHV